MRLSAPLSAVLACAALAPAAAQENTLPTFTEVLGTVNPLGALPADGVGVPTFADLTGDGVPDLLYDPAEVIEVPPMRRGAGMAALFGPARSEASASRRSGGGADFLFFRGVRGADGHVGFVPADANPFAALATDAPAEVVANPALADLDGDGDLDLIATAFLDFDGRVVYFENVGTATAPAFAYRDDADLSAVVPGFISLADLDGDGDADLTSVLPAEDGAQVSYFENVGTSEQVAFAAAASPFGDAAFPLLTFAPAFFDADGDGDLDAAVGGVDLGGTVAPVLQFFENTGSRTAPAFSLADAQPFADLGVSPFADDDTVAPAAADLDGDGDMDLAVVLGIGPFPRSVYFENVGEDDAVAFAQAPTLANPIRFSALDPERDNDTVYAPATTGDLDGDGDLDLVFGTSDFGTLRYAENVGSAQVPAFRLQQGDENPFASLPFEDLASPTLADLDGDGDLDLVVAIVFGDDDAPGLLVYAENVGTAQAPAFELREGPQSALDGLLPGLSPTGTDFADLDGDGDLDLVIATLDPDTFAAGLRYAENVGTAEVPDFALAPAGTGPLPAVDGFALVGPTLADLDGDGDLDLVLAQANVNSEVGLGPVRVFQNVGTATAASFAERTGSALLFGGEVPLPSRVALGDFDGDGDADAFSGAGTLLPFDGEDFLTGSEVRFFLNNGDTRVAAEPGAGPRAGLALGAVYPNPFTGAAQLRLALGDAQHVDAEVFDALGRRVAVLHDGVLPAGADHVLRFDGSGLPAGLYVIRVQSAEGSAVRRVTKL